MGNKFLFYCSIWCPLEDVRTHIREGKQLLKTIIDFVRDYRDEEGVTFFELTEEALKNLPVLMVDNMKCFNKVNIDTMVYNIKEIKCTGQKITALRDFFEISLPELIGIGFNGEILIVKEVKVAEQNIGKTVGRKGYEIYYHKQFK